jgi:thioredoxin-related protein
MTHRMTRIGALLTRMLALAAALSAASAAGAAELVMFERDGCPYCERFDREIGPIYGRTAEGVIAPLRRVDIHRPKPGDLNFIAMERLTPVFVLVENRREIGRIRGYPGEGNFWGLLDGLIDKLHPAARAAVY